MVNVRPHPAQRPQARFSVLLTEDRPRPAHHWTHQLPRLLEPFGVHTHIASTGQQALAVAEEHSIHAAVIDLATPYGNRHDARRTDRLAAGFWLLDLMRRLPDRPPVVAVSTSATQAEVDRIMNEGLRLGAFTVITGPIQIDALLHAFQRVVDRRYNGRWPNHLQPRTPSPDTQEPLPE